MPELEALRGRHWRFEDLSLQNDPGTVSLEGVQGDTLELLIRFAPTDAAVIGVQVRCSPDGSECAEIAYDREARRLGGAPLELGGEEDLVLRVYVDRSVIEAFANGRACHTLRFYPQREDCLGVSVFARGGCLKVRSIDAWKLCSIGERSAIEQKEK